MTTSVRFYHDNAYYKQSRGYKSSRRKGRRHDCDYDLEKQFRSTSLNSTNWRSGHKICNEDESNLGADSACWRSANRKLKEQFSSRTPSQSTYNYDHCYSYEQLYDANCLEWCDFQLDHTDFESSCDFTEENENYNCVRDKDLDDSLSIIYENCSNALDIHAECIAIKAEQAKQMVTEMWLRSRTPEEQVLYIQHRNAVDPRF
mmetsp:Transcript_3264/g.5087  ORF Transcript_3264/g.5087 Transcript_3264/m.5087 type:complete len:203 (-) Transcript_3264:74-682(-)